MKSDEASYSKCLKTGRAAAPPVPLVPSALWGGTYSPTTFFPTALLL